MTEAIEIRLLNELASNVASAFEGMTGERPRTALGAALAPPAPGSLLRQQTFSGFSGAIWIAASEDAWNTGGEIVLEAAGLTESRPEKRKAEFQEIVNQAVSGLARAISQWVGRETRPEGAAEASPPGIPWSEIEVQQGEKRFKLLAAIGPALAAAIAQPEQALETAHQRPPAFDLLLDVELPISVSFGRAEVPLKDVLKLTTGSIVELDRAIGDPVEVIVNNCVIARGEIVTVEGNFGVRIQEVVSRQERWETVG